MKSKNRGLIIALGIGFTILIVAGVLGLRFILGGASSEPDQKRVNVVVLNKDGQQFSLDSSGNATWSGSGENKSELWEREKTASFFEYYYANWASDATVTGDTAYVNPGSDELGSVVTGGGSGGSGGGGGGGGGGDISQYFQTPTPTPNSGTGGGDTGGGGNGGGPSWCIHWKLSYCADQLPDSPTPTPTATPSGPTPLPPDCNNVGNQQTGRTVIGNDLCLPSPTPTP